jgi:hypothetical protein
MLQYERTINWDEITANNVTGKNISGIQNPSQSSQGMNCLFISLVKIWGSEYHGHERVCAVAEDQHIAVGKVNGDFKKKRKYQIISGQELRATGKERAGSLPILSQIPLTFA